MKHTEEACQTKQLTTLDAGPALERWLGGGCIKLISKETSRAEPKYMNIHPLPPNQRSSANSPVWMICINIVKTGRVGELTEYGAKLIENYPKRLTAVKKVNGNTTKYWLNECKFFTQRDLLWKKSTTNIAIKFFNNSDAILNCENVAMRHERTVIFVGSRACAANHYVIAQKCPYK